jgi:transketolase
LVETSHSFDPARRVADAVRRRVLAHTIANDGGYLSQACSAAELLATLYTRVLRLGASEGPPVPDPFPGVPGPGAAAARTALGGRYNGPRTPHLDRFFFSPVHYALVLYATLIETGRMAAEALDLFNRDGSTVELIGAEHSPGIEVTAGSLAQLLSVAGGVALGRRLKGETGRVVAFLSDGEFQEGQTWEAIAALSWHRLDNLVAFVDANGQQCDGAMTSVMGIEPLADRLRAFGATAVEVDGHDPDAIVKAAGVEHPGRPLVIVGRTDPCHGLGILRARAPGLHYVRFRSPEEKAAYAQALADHTRRDTAES